MTLRFDVGFDLTAFGSVKIDDSESGFTATLTSGKWAHVDMSDVFDGLSTYGEFASQVNNALSSAGIGASVAYSTTTARYTITAGTFDINLTMGADEADNGHARMGQVLGFSTSPGLILGGATSTGDAAPYFMIDADMGGASNASDDYEGGQSEDAEAEDGTSYGVSPTTAPTYSDFVVPFEPRAIVYSRDAVTTAPWTWQHFFQHTRVVHPFAVTDDYGDVTVHKLRAGNDRFKPRRVARDWRELHDITVKTRVLGRL